MALASPSILAATTLMPFTSRAPSTRSDPKPDASLWVSTLTSLARRRFSPTRVPTRSSRLCGVDFRPSASRCTRASTSDIRASRGRAGDRLDAANALGDTRLGGDPAQADIAGAPHMGAAAEFDGIVAPHGQYAHLVAVLLIEKGNGALLDGSIEIHAGNADIRVGENLLVDQRLDLGQLPAVTGCPCEEVESQVFRIHQRSHLAHVWPEHLSQRRVQEVGAE